MELSLAGLLGAMIGSLLGAINSVAIIGYAQGWLAGRQPVSTDADRAQFEERAAVMRRSILAVNILLCAGIGYWFGKTLGG
jgi:hypothetical protein